MVLSLSKLQEMVKDREAGVLQSMGSQKVNMTTKQEIIVCSLKLMEGLGTKVFLQIRDKVHWWGLGRGWSITEKALKVPAQLCDETN